MSEFNGKPKTICVFCGSRYGADGRVRDAAREVGRLIGAQGHRLVYGYGFGLMSDVADAAVGYGAEVTGVVPRFLYEEEGVPSDPRRTVIVTETVFERKAEMVARADAFLALPGGYGTLDEVFEVLTLIQLRVLAKPLILLDVADYWQRLAALIDHLVSDGYVAADQVGLLRRAGSPRDALDLLASASGTPASEAAAG